MHVLLFTNTKRVFPTEEFRLGMYFLVFTRQCVRLVFLYTGCPRRNVKYFGRVFLMLNYTDITQNTYIQI